MSAFLDVVVPAAVVVAAVLFIVRRFVRPKATTTTPVEVSPQLKGALAKAMDRKADER